MSGEDVLKLDERGLLPEGIHDVTWEVLDAVFGRFQRTERRIQLCQKLKTYIEELRRSGLGEAIVIDGSFVMGQVDEPSDIDVVVVMKPGWVGEGLTVHQENLLGKAARKNHRVEVKPVIRDSEPEANRIEFYSQVNPKWANRFNWPAGLKKGLLRIHL